MITGSFEDDERCGICGADEEQIVNAGDEDEEYGTRRTKRMQDPRKPSPEEVEEHNKTHLPYRCWCRHCLRGRGKELPHCTKKDGNVSNEVHFDFLFHG